MNLASIGYIGTPYPTKFGVPRQPELASDIDCTVVVDIASFYARFPDMPPGGAYLWAIWSFSKNEQAARAKFSPTVRPPLLDGTKRVGVFATRSSFRPNSLAISALRVSGTAVIEDGAVRIPVTGADVVDETPLFELLPYIPSLHAHPDAPSGWTAQKRWEKLEVAPVDAAMMRAVDESLRNGLIQLLEQDPRPAYTRSGQENRTFWVPFADVAVFFKVVCGVLHVTSIVRLSPSEHEELVETGTVQRFAQEHALCRPASRETTGKRAAQ